MLRIFNARRLKTYRVISFISISLFVFSSMSPIISYAQSVPYSSSSLGVLPMQALPHASARLSLSDEYVPAHIKGITLHPDNPLRFSFLVDSGKSKLTGKALYDESLKLARYFLASLTTPEENLWVNLSPYEKNRIVPEKFGQTEMGRDLLAQDYLLKQLTSSLIYPEEEIGHKFWKRIYQKAFEEYGTTDIPLNTFNKIWIVPDKAVVYEHGQSVFVVNSRLKVLLEEDYLATQNHNRENKTVVKGQLTGKGVDAIQEISSKVVREIIIPEIESEVNSGKNFSNLRQIVNAMILASWYKQNFKKSLLGQIYMDQDKIKGINTNDEGAALRIYNQYLEAFKVGVYDYIKEEVDPITKAIVPRKYFSGGFRYFNRIESTDFSTNGSNDKSMLINGIGPVNSFVVDFKEDNALMSDSQGASDEETVKDGNVLFDNSSGYTHNNVHLKKDQKNIQGELKGNLASGHKELLTLDEGGKLDFMGKISIDDFEELKRIVHQIKTEGYGHVVVVTEQSKDLMETMLQVLIKTSDWNEVLQENELPQIHFINSNERDSISKFINANYLDSKEASKVKVINLGTSQDKKYAQYLFEEISRVHENRVTVEISTHDNLTLNMLSLVIAGLANEDAMDKIYDGAKRAYQSWKKSSGEMTKNAAYLFATNQIRYGLTGQNMSVFMMFSRKYSAYSAWLAQQFNRHVGASELELQFSGETASAARHATGQGHAQSREVGYDQDLEEKAKKGFIALNYLSLNDALEDDTVVVEDGVNKQFVGFRPSELLKQDRAAQEMAFKLSASRLVLNMTFDVNDLEDFGEMIHFGEVSASMAGWLAKNNLSREETIRQSFDAKVENFLERDSESDQIENGTLQMGQNIITFENNQLAGVIGSKIQEALARGDKKLFHHLVKEVSRFIAPKKGLSKILKDVKSKQNLIHVDPEFSLKEIEAAEEMAKVYADYDEIYVTAIGGSTSGDYLVKMIQLQGGPKIKFITDYDQDRLKIIKDRIRNNPQRKVGLVRISKSGVTLEELANASVIEKSILESRIDALTQSGIEKDIAKQEALKHLLYITDPSIGDLREKAERLGIRSLDHPEHGGRFTMFTSLGFLFYFLKGGSKEDLMESMEDWKEDIKKMKVSVKETEEFRDILDLSKEDERFDAFKRERSPSKIGDYSFFNEAIVAFHKTALSSFERSEIESQMEAIKQVFLLADQVPGALRGFLRTFITTIQKIDSTLQRDTHVGMTFHSNFSEFVSPQSPFYQQVDEESTGKPGARRYVTAIDNLTNIKEQLPRLVSNKRVSVDLFGEVALTGEGGTEEAKRDQAIWDALAEVFTENGVPMMTTRMSPMSVWNLNELMRMLYIDVAVSAEMYTPVQICSTGQDGVQLAKMVTQAIHQITVQNIEVKVREFASKIESGVLKETREKLINEKRMRLRKESIVIPDLPHDKIEKIIEWDMNVHEALGIDQGISDFIENVVKGTAVGKEGFLTLKSRRDIAKLPKHEIPGYVKGRLMAFIQGNENILSSTVDGEDVALQHITGKWHLVATSLESKENLPSGTVTGTNFQIYEKNNGRIEGRAPICSVNIYYGSDSNHVIVSRLGRAIDFTLLPDGKVVEIVKSSEDNFMRMPKYGSYISMGGASTGWPQGVQGLVNEMYLPLFRFKIRHENSLTPDMYLMMNKMGLYTGWVTYSELLGLGQTMEGAGGAVMIMTEKGMVHVKDLDIELTEEKLKEQVEIYVYSGVNNLVEQVQIWMNFIDPMDLEKPIEQAQVSKLLDICEKIGSDENSADALKANAIMLLLRFKKGLDELPVDDDLMGIGKPGALIVSIRDRIPGILKNLDQENVMFRIRNEYLSKKANERQENLAPEFLILGTPEALMRSAVKAGEETKALYVLERRFQRLTAWELIENLAQSFNGFNASTEKEKLDLIKESLSLKYQENVIQRARVKTEIPDMSFEEDVSTYLEENLRIPVSYDIPLEEENKLLRKTREITNHVFNIFNNDIPVMEMELDEAQKDIIEELMENEPHIFMKDETGKPKYIHNLLWIIANTHERKGLAITNASGDVSSRLDHIFNEVLKYVFRPMVHLIISEEEKYIVYGAKIDGDRKIVIEEKDKTDGYRVVFIIDPIDGSSQIKERANFGSIFTIGYLKPGQTIEAGGFNTRKNVLLGFDMQFGPTTQLLMSLPANSEGVGEIAEFALAEKDDGLGDKVFRKEIVHPNILDIELDSLNWEGGLIPVANPDDPETAIHMAMGGSIADSIPGLGVKQIIMWLKKTYGSTEAYTGGLINDIRKILVSHLLPLLKLSSNNEKINLTQAIEKVLKGEMKSFKMRAGMLHLYPKTANQMGQDEHNPEEGGRFRLTFEEIVYWWAFHILGAEVTNGVRPMANIQVVGENPSEIKAPFFAASAWISKLIVSWSYFVMYEWKGEKSDLEMNKAFEQFLIQYKEKTTSLIKEMIEIGRTDDWSERDIRKELFLWDASEGKIKFSELLKRKPQEVFDLLQIQRNDRREDLKSFKKREAERLSLSEGDEAMVNSLSVETIGTVNGIHRKGGIDLNPNLFDVKIKRDVQGVPLPVDKQPIVDINIDGLIPVIINVTPVTNLPMLMGFADQKEKKSDFSYEFPLGKELEAFDLSRR